MFEIKLHLEALLESIEKIKLYSKDFTNADDFYHEPKSFDATMMQYYFGIDAEEIWDILQNKLLPPQEDIENLKKELS